MKTLIALVFLSLATAPALAQCNLGLAPQSYTVSAAPAYVMACSTGLCNLQAATPDAARTRTVTRTVTKTAPTAIIQPAAETYYLAAVNYCDQVQTYTDCNQVDQTTRRRLFRARPARLFKRLFNIFRPRANRHYERTVTR